MSEPNWMSSVGVTVADARNGNVLVMQQRPEDGVGVCVWALEARAGQSLRSLARALARKYAPGVNQLSSETHDRALVAHAARLDSPVRVLIEGADRLPPSTLSQMHALAEGLNGVVLVGDLMTIGAKMRGCEAFMRWAHFCVRL